MWHRTLRGLIDALDSASRVARLHVHEHASRFRPLPFAELPHIGSRNLREGELAKLFYHCTTEPQRRTTNADYRATAAPVVI